MAWCKSVSCTFGTFMLLKLTMHFWCILVTKTMYALHPERFAREILPAEKFWLFVSEGGPILIQYHFLKVDPPKCGGCPACGSDGDMLTLARTRVCVADKKISCYDHDGKNGLIPGVSGNSRLPYKFVGISHKFIRQKGISAHPCPGHLRATVN